MAETVTKDTILIQRQFICICIVNILAQILVGLLNNTHCLWFVINSMLSRDLMCRYQSV